MTPALSIGMLWLLFGATHVGLAAGPVRTRLVRRLGETGFLALFWLVAASCFALLAHAYGTLSASGAPGPTLGAVAGLRVILVASAVAGVVLMVAAFAGYGRSPYAAPLSAEAARRVRGLERVTRHPFFVGMTAFALAHALLAPRLVGTVFFGGFALLASAGAWHQDRKLLALRGEPFAAYLRATSAVPFAAIVAGRQRLVWREMPGAGLALGAGVAALLYAVHAAVVTHVGSFLIVVVLGGAALATARSPLLRSRRESLAVAGRVADGTAE